MFLMFLPFNYAPYARIYTQVMHTISRSYQFKNGTRLVSVEWCEMEIFMKYDGIKRSVFVWKLNFTKY